MVEIQSLEEFRKKLVSFRFAILRHQLPADSVRSSHWDLLLEKPNGLDEALLTFAATTPPEEWGNATVVQQLPDHRAVYLDYDGPVSGNRGIVCRVVNGTLQWKEFSTKRLIATVQFSGTPDLSDKVHVVKSELRLRKLTDQLGNCSQWELALVPTS